jgi:hypothetical protein
MREGCRRERGWGGGEKSDEDVYEILIMDDCLRKISARSSLTRQGVVLYLPTLSHFLIVNKTSLSFSPATCERGFSLRTQILTAQRYSMGDSLLACLIMIVCNGPSLDQKEEVAFKKRVPSKCFVGKRPQRASAQRASASLTDSVPIESEEERTACEQDEIAALDVVGDYEADVTVILEYVPQDQVIKTLKVWCACVSVLVFACECVCVCVCVCAPSI